MLLYCQNIYVHRCRVSNSYSSSFLQQRIKFHLQSQRCIRIGAMVQSRVEGTLNVIKWGLTWWLSGEESACQSNRDIDKEQTCGHSEERRRWDKLGEQHENICITLCKTDSQWEFAVWLRTSNLVLCDNLEDWDGMGGEREVQEGRDICIPMADSCWYLAENNKIL